MVLKYTNSLEALRAAGDLFSYVHPDYRYYKEEWDLIRDAIAGERRVKDMGMLYLPPLGDNAGTSYDSYRTRAVYVNMTARTVSGLLGTLFRRHPKILGVPPEIRAKMADITPDHLDMAMFSKIIANEILQVGRVGVLVDMDEVGAKLPYMTYYVAENILSWKTETVEGREVLTYVLLREIIDDQLYLGIEGSTAPVQNPVQVLTGADVNKRRQTRVTSKAASKASTPVLRARYRVLALQDGKYMQRVYDTVISVAGTMTLAADPVTTVPLHNGAPLDHIPFVIIGTNGPSAKVTRSPMYDIAALNISHYRSSAQLEHGRYFTALPVYYVPISQGQEGGEYTIGPSVVWEVPGDGKPGILEYFGTGLRELANSLGEKEHHISQLGGRIMGITRDAGSQAPEVAALTQANEMSVLMNVCDATSAGLTRAAQWWMEWANFDNPKDVLIRLNRDFASANIGAREMRAISTLYLDGLIPVQELHRVFQEAELIADDVTVEEFEALLKNPKSFPNQPNFSAREEGYADAAGRNQYNIAKLGSKTELDAIDKQGSVDKAQQIADQKHQQLIQQRQHEQQTAQAEIQSKEARRTQQFEARKAPKKPKAT